MRKKQTFLLTILTPETEGASFCGRLKVISSGKTCTFTSLNELYQLITSEMGEEILQNFMQQDLSLDSSENTISLP